MSGRIENERDFHNESFTTNLRDTTRKFYAITGASNRYYHSVIEKDCDGLEILEYGCGTGSAAFDLMEAGAKVTAIDISDAAIELASGIAEERGLKGEFLRMNAEDLTFEDGRFDRVVGSSIIHHLELESAYEAIARVLREGGSAHFLEPLAGNPAIDLYRYLTPKLRTPDEHPLVAADLELAKKYFGRVEVEYYHLSTFAAVPFRRLAAFERIRDRLDRVDKRLFSAIPASRWWAWTCVLSFSEPYKS
jgi:SAM-dependent methyltransferase